MTSHRFHNACIRMTHFSPLSPPPPPHPHPTPSPLALTSPHFHSLRSSSFCHTWVTLLTLWRASSYLAWTLWWGVTPTHSCGAEATRRAMCDVCVMRHLWHGVVGATPQHWLRILGPARCHCLENMSHTTSPNKRVVAKCGCGRQWAPCTRLWS